MKLFLLDTKFQNYGNYAARSCALAHKHGPGNCIVTEHTPLCHPLMLPGPWGTQILQDQFRSRAWRRSVGYSVPVRIQKHWHEVCTFLWVTKQFVSGNDAWDSAGTPKEGGILSPTCGQGWWRFSCWTESSARTYQPLAWANFPHAQVLETNLQIAAFDADLLQSWTLISAEVCRSVFFLDPDLHLIHYAIGVHCWRICGESVWKAAVWVPVCSTACFLMTRSLDDGEKEARLVWNLCGRRLET